MGTYPLKKNGRKVPKKGLNLGESAPRPQMVEMLVKLVFFKPAGDGDGISPVNASYIEIDWDTQVDSWIFVWSSCIYIQQ